MENVDKWITFYDNYIFHLKIKILLLIPKKI